MHVNYLIVNTDEDVSVSQYYSIPYCYQTSQINKICFKLF